MSTRRLANFAAAACAVLLIPVVARADWLSELAPSFQRALASGHWGPALGLVFAAGLATSLTPCVYPMIVITVSVFGARQAKSRVEGAGLSTAFVLGMAALFTPLGVFAGVTGSVFGAALANPLVLLALALIFLALAASMFGAFELSLPPALQNRLAQVGGLGYKGAFALGLVSALIAAPCTGPVLAVLLAWIGTTRNVGFGALSLFVYACGLGMLFWIVGTFAVGLPKSGRWLDWVKSVFGIVMIIMALFFVRDLLPDFTRPVVQSHALLIGGLALTIVGLGLGAVHLSFYEPSRAVRARKAVAIALTVLGAFTMVRWMEAPAPGAKIAWLSDYASAKQRAAALGLPLLVDFGASWCGACKELDHNTFQDPRVVAEGQRFVPVRVDLSPGEDTPEKRAILASYNQRGLPLVVMHDRSGAEKARVTSFVDADSFLGLMRKVD